MTTKEQADIIRTLQQEIERLKNQIDKLKAIHEFHLNEVTRQLMEVKK